MPSINKRHIILKFFDNGRVEMQAHYWIARDQSKERVEPWGFLLGQIPGRNLKPVE